MRRIDTQKETVLRENGFVIGARDPRLNTATWTTLRAADGVP